jgi:thiol-disulfide isomerase/thioredoxin
MRIRFIVLALLALAEGACAMPVDGTGQTSAAASATTTAGPATNARKGPARRPPPPGILPAARRKPAPVLRVTTFDGRTVTLDGFRGRPVVVSFFESWCGTCQVEQPDLTKVAAEFAGQAGFVGISYHDTVAAGLAYQRRFKIPYPLANDPLWEDVGPLGRAIPAGRRADRHQGPSR